MEDFNKTIELNPKCMLAYCGRAVVYKHTRKHKEVIEEFTNALKIDPSYTLAYVHRGLEHRIIKQYKDAINDFTKSTRDGNQTLKISLQLQSYQLQIYE